jgi:hypothetical protein
MFIYVYYKWHIHFHDSTFYVVFLSGSKSVQDFIVCLYIVYVLLLEIQLSREEGLNLIIWFNATTILSRGAV